MRNARHFAREMSSFLNWVRSVEKKNRTSLRLLPEMEVRNEFAPQLGPGNALSISNAYYVENPLPGLFANRFSDSVRGGQKMAFPDTTPCF